MTHHGIHWDRRLSGKRTAAGRKCGTPAFLRETIALCRQITDEPLLIRLDSGNDSAENIGILLESGCCFIIKRNLRRESKDGWFEMAKANSQNITIPR